MRNVLFTRSNTPNQKKIKTSTSPEKSKLKNEVNQNKLAFINKEIFSKPHEIAQYNLKKINKKNEIHDSPPKTPPKSANLRSAIARKSPPRYKPLDEKFKNENSFFKFLLNNVNPDDHEPIFESRRGGEDKEGWKREEEGCRREEEGRRKNERSQDGRRREEERRRREEKGGRRNKEQEQVGRGEEDGGRRRKEEGGRRGYEEILEEMREEKERFYEKLNGIRGVRREEEEFLNIESEETNNKSQPASSLPLALLVSDLENSRNSKLKEVFMLKDSLKELEEEGVREELEVKEAKQSLLRDVKEIERENEVIKTQIKKAGENIFDMQKTENESLKLLDEVRKNGRKDEEIIKIKLEIEEFSKKIKEEEERERRMEERRREEGRRREEEETGRKEFQKLTLELDNSKQLIKNLEIEKKELENQLKEEEGGGREVGVERKVGGGMGGGGGFGGGRGKKVGGLDEGEVEGGRGGRGEGGAEGGKELKRLKDEVVKRERDIYLMKQMNDLRKQTKAKEQERYLEEIFDLEAKLKSLEESQKYKFNENKIIKLDEEILKLSQSKQELETQSKLRISEIQLEISQIQNDLSSKDQQIKITDQNTQILKNEAKQNLKEFEDKLANLQQTSLSLSSSLSSLQASLSSLQVSLSSIQISSLPPFPLTSSSLPPHPLTSSFVPSSPEIDSLTSELQEYQQILETLDNSRSALEEEVSELSKKSAEERQRVEEGRKREEEGRRMLAKLETELEEVRRVNLENAGLLNKMVGEKESLEKELEEIKEVNERMTRDSEKNKITIGEMGRKEEDLGGRVKELEAAGQKKKK